jgi:hypothetical protein
MCGLANLHEYATLQQMDIKLQQYVAKNYGTHNGMKSKLMETRFTPGFAVCLFAAILTVAPAKAQQVAGVLGSPSTTTTINV